MAVVESTEHETTQSTSQSLAIERMKSGPERLMTFLRDTREEMRKVHSPTRAEVQATTIVVVVTVFLFAAYFSAIDAVIGKGIDKMLLQLTKH